MIRLSGTAQEVFIFLGFLEENFKGEIKGLSDYLRQAEKRRGKKAWLMVVDLQAEDDLAEEIILALSNSSLRSLANINPPSQGCSFYAVLGRVFLERIESLD